MSDRLMDDVRTTRRVSDEEVVARTERHALAALRDGIVLTDRRDDEPLVEVPRGGGHLVRRRLVAGGAAAALAVAGTATAYAVLGHNAESSGIMCRLSADSTMGISPVSGNPVADCVAAAQQSGQTVPEGLAAYRADGRIVVAPPDLAPEDGTTLPAGTVQDPAVIALAAALGDAVDAPAWGGSCASGRAWTDYARAELDRIGLDGWTVAGDTSSADCADVFSDDATRTVVIAARPGARPAPATEPAPAAHPDAPDVEGFIAALRTGISQDCVSLSRAEQIVLTAALAHRANEAVSITRFADPGAECARVDLVVGGAFDVRLYGP